MSSDGSATREAWTPGRNTPDALCLSRILSPRLGRASCPSAVDLALTLAEASEQRKRELRGRSNQNVYVQGIISRRRREAVRSSRPGEIRVSLLCNNSEPRPPETTGALMFGWPPEGGAPVQVEASLSQTGGHSPALAESQMATKPVVVYQRFCRNCSEAFYICKSCDRGHCYCGKACSYHAGLIKCRGYNRKDRESVEGQSRLCGPAT